MDLLSTSALKLNVRRCTMGTGQRSDVAGGIDPTIPGEAVQVEPMNPKLKEPGTERFKLQYDNLVSRFAFKSNLRRYNPGWGRITWTRRVTRWTREGARSRGDSHWRRAPRQELTFVRFLAQPEPFLPENYPLTPPDTP
jgi:hypothetical protein